MGRHGGSASRMAVNGVRAEIIPTFNAGMLPCWTSFFRKQPSPVFTVRRARLLMYKISVGPCPQTGTRITHRSVWRRPFKDRRTGAAREIFEAVRNDMVDFGSPSDDSRSLRGRTLLGHYGHGMLWVYSA